ncbi:MAG TPA: HypC/HybG/HupF family hydrogenase formation chaperone [Deltaproteobacteria bacterium]|jgi:hydrogenase expression/formation protein HypC|nr:HypC/HybG/HupF family hydrogenase formation chaperone [Deltaproteobacteria bacterium]
MCLAIPGKVIEIVDAGRQIVKAEVSGVRRNVSAELLGEAGQADCVRVGDWILIHAGFALARINEEEAAATTRLFQAMADAYADELMALRRSEIE